MFLKGKKVISVIVLLVMVLSLWSCSGSNYEKDIDISALCNEGLEAGFTAEMMQLSDNKVTTFYPLLDMDKMDKVEVHIESSVAAADEISVFKVKDKNDIKMVEDALTARIDALIQSVLNYNPSQVERIENAIKIVKGNYVIFVISDNNDAVQKVIDSYFN